MLSWCAWVCMDDVSVMLRSLVLVTTLLKIVFSMSCLLPSSTFLDPGSLMLNDLLTAVLDPFPRSLFQCLQLWAELNTTCLPGVPKRPPPEGHATKPAASDLAIQTHQEIHRQIQNRWIHRWLASPPLRWASGPFPGWMATLTHLNASNGWSNAPNPRPFRRRWISFVGQTRTTPISVTTALIGTGDTNHS